MTCLMKKEVDLQGIEPRTSHMQSERATTVPQAHLVDWMVVLYMICSKEMCLSAPLMMLHNGEAG